MEMAAWSPFSHTTNTDCVAIGDVAIQPWLWSVGLVEYNDGWVWCGVSPEFHCLGLVLSQCLLDLLGTWRRRVFESERYESHVSVGYSDSGTGGADL